MGRLSVFVLSFLLSGLGAKSLTAGVTCCRSSPCTASPDPDPWSVRLPSAGFGGIVTERNSGFTDTFLLSPNGTTRIGARLDWGGTVVFFGLSSDPNSNVIDAHDTGRELQLALYDPDRAHQPCACNATCVSHPAECADSISYLGWDPVQGGDKCDIGAPVLFHGQSGDALRLVIEPLQWNHDWDRCDCGQTPCGKEGRSAGVQYVFELRFVSELVVEIMSEVDNTDVLNHAVTGQEFPCLYVSHGDGGPDLPVLVSSNGTVINIAQPFGNGYMAEFTSDESWVSYQDPARDYGVGLMSDQGVTDFLGCDGNATNPGAYYHYVRPSMNFGIPAGYDTVADELRALRAARPPFGHVDVPAYSTTPITYQPGAAVPIAGWVLDSVQVAFVTVEVDGVLVGKIPTGTARPDVCVDFPEYDGCPNVGFTGSLDTSGLDSCAHLLRVVATDDDGNASVLAERVIAPA